MRRPEIALLLTASLCVSACVVSSSSEHPPSKLTAGFWFWNGSAADPRWTGEPLDVLFVHVGTIRKETVPPFARTGTAADERWYAYGQLPNDLPNAREYWLVFRYERQGLPDLQAAPIVAREVSRLLAAARTGHLSVVGVQLDIDSPTGALTQYAAFLREVRKELPPGFKVSITALLDWFRSGTAIAEVIKETDEFVPQFYDLANPSSDYNAGTTIAAKIDAARWGPVFNRFRKPFRVGISTFGRARMVPRAAAGSGNLRLAAFYGDLAPIDIATNPAFELQTKRNQANELVLSYRATRKTQIGYNKFDQGDAVQFILATPESVRAAMESVRRMTGYLAGVVFFRWPSSNESLAMQPDEALIAAGLPAQPRRMQIHSVDCRCAAVKCVDVYLESADPLSPKPLRCRIRTSTELEYFLPEKNVPVRMMGPAQLELSLPPYCGRGRLYLGRAVSSERSEFSVEEEH